MMQKSKAQFELRRDKREQATRLIHSDKKGKENAVHSNMTRGLIDLVPAKD